MPSWFSSGSSSASAAVTALQQRLRAAERRLLDTYAPRFAAGGRSNDGSTTTSWQAVDTLIARHVVPLPKHVDLAGSNNNNNKDGTYTMHSIRVVTSTTTDDNDKKDNANNKSTTPLVLLHGYMNGGAYFYRNVMTLSRYFSAVHAVDLLGWGLSSRPQWPTSSKTSLTCATAEDVLVESLEAWRAAQPNLERMILTGHSMGGYTAVAYAERYPERVEQLVLLSPVGVPADSAERRAQQEEQMKQARASWRFRALIYTWQTLFAWNVTAGQVLRSLPTQRAQHYVEGYLQARIPALRDVPDERQAVADYLYLNSALPGSGEYWVTACLHANLMAKQPLMERIPKLRGISNVTFLYGSHDWMDPVTGGLATQQACANNQEKGAPHVTVQMVQDAGHLLLLDNPHAVNAAIIAASSEPGTKFARQHLFQGLQSIRTLQVPRLPTAMEEEEEQQQRQRQEALTTVSLSTEPGSS